MALGWFFCSAIIIILAEHINSLMWLSVFAAIAALSVIFKMGTLEKKQKQLLLACAAACALLAFVWRTPAYRIASDMGMDFSPTELAQSYALCRKKQIQTFEKYAKKGNILSMIFLADHYATLCEGDSACQPPDYEKAAMLYEEAASQFERSNLYKTLKKEAQTKLKKDLTTNATVCWQALGDAYMNGTNGYEVNEEKAEQAYNRANRLSRPSTDWSWKINEIRPPKDWKGWKPQN